MQTTLDQLMNSKKRIKLECHANPSTEPAMSMRRQQDSNNNAFTIFDSYLNAAANEDEEGGRDSPTSSSSNLLDVKNASTKLLRLQEQQYSSKLDPLSLLSQGDLEIFHRKCQQTGDQLLSTMAESSDGFVGAIPKTITNGSNKDSSNVEESTNILFGRLVANGLLSYFRGLDYLHFFIKELDKLPANMHNLVRAQVLLLLSQAASSASNSTTIADKLLARLSN